MRRRSFLYTYRYYRRVLKWTRIHAAKYAWKHRVWAWDDA